MNQTQEFASFRIRMLRTQVRFRSAYGCTRKRLRVGWMGLTGVSGRAGEERLSSCLLFHDKKLSKSKRRETEHYTGKETQAQNRRHRRQLLTQDTTTLAFQTHVSTPAVWSSRRPFGILSIAANTRLSNTLRPSANPACHCRM